MVSLLLNLVLGIATMGPAGRANPQTEQERVLNLVGGVCGAVVGALWGSFILFGALRMKGLQNYGLAMAASIVAMVPCSHCCLLGLPFGIWSLVVLSKPEVKDAFT